MDYKYPTAFSKWDGEEYWTMQDVISSGKFTMGPRVKAFEEAFATYHDKKFGIMVNSGSSANLIAVAALADTGAIKRDDGVAVPAIAWSTTYAPLVQYGLKIHLLDVDNTWNAPLTPVPSNVKLIIGCSILGNPAYLDEWAKYTEINGLFMIEDNCESFGAKTSGGRLCGTFGDMSTFSFFYSHQISAIEGGMILTDNQHFADACRILRAHGWTRDVRIAKDFDDEYNFVSFGYNVRPLEMHAAIAKVQLAKQGDFCSSRQKNLNYFWGAASTANLPIVGQVLNGWQVNPFGISFLVESTEKRAALAQKLREAGIDCRLPTGGSFRLHPYGAGAKQRTVRADEIHRHGMFLGNAPYPIDALIDSAIGVMKEFFHG